MELLHLFLSGHRAFECVSNIQGKQKCYYCKRRNHHHRRLCQWKFGLICHQNVKSTNSNDLRDANTQRHEKHELVSEEKKVKIIRPQSNIESEYYLIRNNLAFAKLELAECKKEIETLKDNITESENERKSMEESVRVYIEVINQQKEEISRLREHFRSTEHHKVGIYIPETMHRNFERSGTSGADLEMNMYPKEENYNFKAGVIKKNAQRNGNFIKCQITKYHIFRRNTFDMEDKTGEYLKSNAAKTFNKDAVQTEFKSSHEDIKETTIEDRMGMLNSFLQRQTKLQNRKTASFDIDSINERQSAKAWIRMLSILSGKNNHSNQANL